MKLYTFEVNLYNSICLFVSFTGCQPLRKASTLLSPKDQADGAPLLPLLEMESAHRPPLLLALECIQNGDVVCLDANKSPKDTHPRRGKRWEPT